MTMAVPGITKAGNWKHKDFPPPVGIRTNVSLPSSRLRIIFSWSPLKESKPKNSFSLEFSNDESISIEFPNYF